MTYFVDYLPITTDNDLKLYIDGKDYCADLYTELGKATKFVFLTGLHFMAFFRLIRKGVPSDDDSSLVRILAKLGNRGVRVFLLVNQFWKNEDEVTWLKYPVNKAIMETGKISGYLPETRRLFNMLFGFANIHCRTDIHTHSDTFGTNHQKTVVIDDTVAFLGGIDLTFVDGDRWDTNAHRKDQRAIDRTQKYWHDVHLRVQGPAVQFVRDNFIQRWKYGNLHIVGTSNGSPIVYEDKDRPRLPLFSEYNYPTGYESMYDVLPISKYQYPNGNESPDLPTVQIVRSMPRKPQWKSEKPAWNKSTREWERSCKDAYLIGIRSAKKYIYLENQWIADEDIWSELASAAKRNNKNPDFRIILMVPYEGLFAAGMGSNQELFIGAEMEKVMNASYNDGTFGMYSLMQSGSSGPTAQIYVHSKILIVDDEWALIGSANAGGISLEGVRGGKDEPDTELSAIILDKKFAAHFRQSLWEEHLGLKVNSNYDVHDADQFRRLAGRGYGSTKIRFFPGYDKIKRGVPTWFPITPDPSYYPIEPYRKKSRIIPSFSEDLRWNLPPTLIDASFKAYIVPDIPPGYRCWYRWACDLFEGGRRMPRGVPFRLRSLKNDKDDVFEYNDQASVYIGKKTAEAIDRRIKGLAEGSILCRVQFVPLGDWPDDTNVKFPSLLLVYDLKFINADFAKKVLAPRDLLRLRTKP
jgi:phosphatidylserine/phosphatidylglycerophosphate/cardiolipin synthase-like enzyme